MSENIHTPVRVYPVAYRSSTQSDWYDPPVYQCEQIYVGHETTDDRIVSHGTTTCQQCGSETFERVTLTDLGLADPDR